MKPPEARAMIAAGLFALVFYIFTLIALVPNITDNKLFETLATLIVGSGFISGVIAFYYSANKNNDGDGK